MKKFTLSLVASAIGIARTAICGFATSGIGLKVCISAAILFSVWSSNVIQSIYPKGNK